MSPIGEVGGVTEHPVTAPRDDVRRSRHYIQGAPGAEVRFYRLLCGDRLHVPEAVTPNLTPAPPGKKVLEITVVISPLRNFPAPGSITARHDASLKRRSRAGLPELVTTWAN